MATNTTLHSAKKSKNDEFYTQLSDIESELRHYEDHFRGKVVYCNCDDWEKSNFVRYFRDNFKRLGLQKLTTTCYVEDGRGKFFEYDGTCTKMRILKHDGDFGSAPCTELLEQSDIIVTNPPFSLFREHVAQLEEHNKKFILIGSLNAITYKEIFRLIKDNKFWLGVNGVKEFTKPDGSTQKFGNINWFTNLDLQKRHTDLVLDKEYQGNESSYPKYDNYDGINVNKVKDIPHDYRGHIGVPITFLDKYNPNQFEIIKFRKGDDDKDLSIGGKCPYFRILVRKIT